MFLTRRTTTCLLILVCLAAAAFLSDVDPVPATASASSKHRSSMSQLKPPSSSSSSSSTDSSSGGSGSNNGPSAPSQPARVISWVKDAASRISDSLPTTSSSLTALKGHAGKPIMPKMGNETLRAALGHSSWHLIHTMGNTYPQKPSKDEQNAMLSFIQLLGRLYPCGDCAQHFQQMLSQHPPEPHLGSRDDLSQYLCKLHNKVNLRLGHKIFDCNLVGDRWKCGCAGTEKEETEKGKKKKDKNKNNKKQGEDKDLRLDLPMAAANGKFTAGQNRDGVSKLAGDEVSEDDFVDVDVDKDEQKLLAALSPLERTMRLEFRSMFPEDYAEALKRAQEAPPRYPAPPREPGWIMDVHGNLVKDTSVEETADPDKKDGEKTEEAHDSGKDPREKVVVDDTAA